MRNTGPPYPIQLNILEELNATRTMVDNDAFTKDLDFQEHVQAILTTTLDAHTRYNKPACYSATFMQPFAFDMRMEASADASGSEPVVYLMRNLATDTYRQVYPNEANPEDVIGKRVVLLNGLELTTEVATWGSTHDTRSNNAGARFNSAIRSYLYRSATGLNILPLTDLTLTLEDGSEYVFPWLASYTMGLADQDFCAAPAEEKKLSLARAGHDHSYPEFIEHARPLVHSALHSSRPDREVIVPTTSPYPVTCFVQTNEGHNASVAGISKTLVMKVSSFSPSGEYMVAATGFLDNVKQCLSADFDMIVIDVMQNGGGSVCLGLRLLELLVEDYAKDHTLVQMNYDLPHSSLMDAYIDVVNSPYPYPDDGIIDPATQEAFPDGKAYYYPGRQVTQGGVVSWRTNYFALNCSVEESLPADNWQPPRYLPPEKLIIITDGTCGSTCACFTKIPQEADKATLIGIGGIWNEGMDVSSFAGGFVTNPDVMSDIATWSGMQFPKFLTNQHWQFDWAIWYSAKQPTRPTQFTVQDPNYRQAFWGFPHVSINASVTTEMVSVLYDQVIDSSVNRMAAAVPEDTCGSDGDDDDTTLLIALIVVVALLGVAAMLLGYVYFVMVPRKRYSFLAKDERDPLQRDLVSSA